MQIETQSFQLPLYESALLKKQRQSKVLSPKVTQIHPEIKQIQKIKLKKHHLDDTEMRQALQYDYEENQLPKQYLFKGNRIDYDKNLYNSRKNVRSPNGNRFTNTGFTQNGQENIKLNTEYFDSQTNFNPFSRPERNISNDPNNSQRRMVQNFQTENNQTSTRLKKSISVSEFESLRRDQQEMEQKVINKLNQIQTQTDQLNRNIQHKQKQKSAHGTQNLITRYKSESKRSSVQTDFSKLKEKLEKQRMKEKHRLEAELQKLKEETKKIKQEQKKRKKSFKEIIQKTQYNKYTDNLILANSNRVPVTLMRASMIDGQILNDNQLQRKYLPKTNIVNKRIQCQIYDPRMDYLRRVQEKPKFIFNNQSDTDSQFSDF